MKRVDIAGQRFDRLVAIKVVGTKRYPSGQPRTIWLFRCDCGVEVEKTLRDVRRLDTKSCGCGRFGNPAANRLPDGEASFNGLFSRYRYSARIRGHSWGLSRDEFRVLTQGNCYYCGAAPSVGHLTHKSANGAYTYNGIDRVDNSSGYEKLNVVTCCSVCNRAKGDMSQEVFIAWVVRANSHLKGGSSE